MPKNNQVLKVRYLLQLLSNTSLHISPNITVKHNKQNAASNVIPSKKSLKLKKKISIPKQGYNLNKDYKKYYIFVTIIFY